MWGAEDTLVETIDFTGGSPKVSAYANSSTWGNWTVVGAANNGGSWAYLRIGGGKNNSSPSTITGTSAIGEAVDYITIEHNGRSNKNFSVSSIVVETSTSTNFSSPTSTTTVSNPDISAAGTITITPASQIPANSYYKITINWSGSTSNNYGLDTKYIKFYQKASTDPSSEVAFSNETPSITFPAQKTYSQEATTAEGYTGTVTYEITDNTAGATIDGATVTVAQAGSVTVKATAPAVTGFAKSEATYTLTVTDSRTSAGLAYAEDAQTVTVGEVLSAPALTNPHSLAVIYSSSDEDIATIDASGNVTGVAVGSATITASFGGNDDYAAGNASYVVTVKKAVGVAADGVFDFSYEDEIDYGTGLQPSTNDIKVQTDFVAGNVTLTVEPTATNKYFRWYTGNPPTLRLYTDTKMTIAVPNGYAITKIDFTGTQNLNSVTVSDGNYTAASGNKSATWTGLSQSVTFTRDSSNPFYTKIVVTYSPIATVSLAAACTDGTKYYGTYSNDKAFVVPADLTVSEISVIDGELLVEDYKAGDIVPANTGVMVSSATAGDHTILLSGETGSSVLGSDNMLKASSVAMEGNNKYYRLTMHNGDTIGFWWGAEDGAAFNIAANKAYLAVPEALAREGFAFDFGGETTGITSAAMQLSTEQYYDLQGRRVAQPTRGLYIVNGRKVVIK